MGFHGLAQRQQKTRQFLSAKLSVSNVCAGIHTDYLDSSSHLKCLELKDTPRLMELDRVQPRSNTLKIQKEGKSFHTFISTSAD